MSEATPMNLDLNLGPVSEAGPDFVPTETVSLEELIDDPMVRIAEVVRVSSRQRRRLDLSSESRSLAVDLNQMIGDSRHAATLQAGEGSLPSEERTEEPPKMCETNNGFLQDEKKDKSGEVEKSSTNDGNLFDCNICFEMASDPVVTRCGHLYCWSCLYLWLDVHSDAKECPVCKGEASMKTVIPIYGRGSSPKEAKDPSLHIPVRPGARRTESWRQAVQRSTYPMEEVIRLLSRNVDQPDSLDEGNAFISRMVAIRGMLSEAPDVVDLTESIPVISQTSNGRRLQTSYVRRPQSSLSRSPTPPSLLSAFNTQRLTAERLVDAYLGYHPSSRNQEQTPPVDDRDSFSSVAAVINSESQLDAAVEIDSMVSLSTSSSRRRIDPSRLADLDTGDSRGPRRRRLT